MCVWKRKEIKSKRKGRITHVIARIMHVIQPYVRTNWPYICKALFFQYTWILHETHVSRVSVMIHAREMNNDVREVESDTSGSHFWPDNVHEILGNVREGPLMYVSFRFTYVRPHFLYIIRISFISVIFVLKLTQIALNCLNLFAIIFPMSLSISGGKIMPLITSFHPFHAFNFRISFRLNF